MINIVVVDDEADTHLLYKLKLKKVFPNPDDIHLISFMNAQDCIQYLQDQNPVDVILSDINMPDIDGFALLSETKKLSPNLPFYIVSAYESAEFRSKAEQLGAQRFLSKPLDFHRLSAYLRKDLKMEQKNPGF